MRALYGEEPPLSAYPSNLRSTIEQEREERRQRAEEAARRT
jgi:hypothetical protein